MHLIKWFPFIQELSKLATMMEIKEMVKQAEIIKLESTTIFNRCFFIFQQKNSFKKKQKKEKKIPTEKEILYLVLSGQLWTLTTNHVETNKYVETPPFVRHPTWWYLIEPSRIENEIKSLIVVQSNLQKPQISDLVDQITYQRNSMIQTNPDEDQVAKNIFLKELIQRTPKIIYSPGSIIRAANNQPLLLAKQNVVLIKIANLDFLYTSIYERLSRQEMEYVSQFYPFSYLYPVVLEQIFRTMSIKQYTLSHQLFHERVDSFCIIKEGEVQLIGKSSAICIIGENQIIGEEEIILNQKIRKYNAIVKSSHLICYTFMMEDYLRIIRAQSEDRVHYLMDQLVGQASRKAKTRKLVYRSNTPKLMDKNSNQIGYDLRQLSPQLRQQIIFKQQIKDRIKQKTLKMEQMDRYLMRNTKGNQKWAIKLSKPLLQQFDMPNEKLENIKTVKQRYNRIACVTRSPSPKYSPRQITPSTISCINQPPQHLLRTINYIRGINGKFEPTDNLNLISKTQNQGTEFPFRCRTQSHHTRAITSLNQTRRGTLYTG